jgi:hypothetical protein
MLGFATSSMAQRGGKGVSMDGDSPLTVRSEGAGTAGENYKGFSYGIVKAVNKDEIVLTKTNAGMDQTFKFNKKTKFIHDGKGSSLESVKLGDKVWVDGAQDKKTGDSIARKVVSGAFIM